MRLRLPLGSSDFAQIRREGLHYVDKTGLVAELLDTPARVVLLPRPRRFGKTLNLSMLRCWFEHSWVGHDGDADAHRALFDGLAVASAGAEVHAHAQRYPVVFLTFKDVKHPEWSGCRAHCVREIAGEVRRLRSVWSRAPLEAEDLEGLARLADEQVSDTDLQGALRLLTRALHLATGEPALVLIDEYDTPIHAGWTQGYYDEAIGLFRNLLSAGLKDNPHLFRGVLTGILRVAKESVFSGLNNVAVYGLLARPFSSWFGFTDAEVTELCRLAGPEVDLDGIRRWYNGYRFGDQVMYNPWSVVSYLGARDDGFRPYWVNTASDELLRRVLIAPGLGLQAELATLLEGGTIRASIAENIQLRDLVRDTTSVWSFLLFCGYLNATDVEERQGRTWVTLTIPNLEVVTSYRSLFIRWLDQGVGGAAQVDALGRSLLSGDEAGFRGRLQRLIVESLSYHDVGGRTPEAVYQAFLVGLLVHLGPTHRVDSNRESGFGRYDVAVRPRTPGAPGAVLELKVIDVDGGETTEAALDAAISQVRTRDYAATIREAGATPVWLWGAVFDGKRVWARVSLAPASGSGLSTA